METANSATINPQVGLADTAKEILQKAHSVAKEEAVKLLPEDDVNAIIATIVEVLGKKKSLTDATKEVAEAHAAAAAAYVKVFAHQALQDTLKQSDVSAVRELTETDFADRLIACGSSMAVAVKGLMAHELSEAQFIEQIGGTDLANLGMDFLGAAGPDGAQLLTPDKLAGLCAPVIGFAATMGAYKILMQALDEATLAHEDRLWIEAQCAQSVAMIRQYRLEMNETVATYLAAHCEAFTAGFAAMDKALIAGDVDGYLKGNAAIQEVLGYKTQFTNQREFDDLMDADTAFKL